MFTFLKKKKSQQAFADKIRALTAEAKEAKKNALSDAAMEVAIGITEKIRNAAADGEERVWINLKDVPAKAYRPLVDELTEHFERQGFDCIDIYNHLVVSWGN